MVDVRFTLTLDGSSVVQGAQQMRSALDGTSVPVQRLITNFVGFSKQLLTASGDKDKFIANLRVLESTLGTVAAAGRAQTISLEEQTAGLSTVAAAVQAAASALTGATGRIDQAYQQVIARQREVTESGKGMRDGVESAVGLFARLFVIQRITKDFETMDEFIGEGSTRLIEMQAKAIGASTAIQVLGTATDDYSRRMQQANNATYFSAATAKLFGDIMKGMGIPINDAARALTAFEEKLVNEGKVGKEGEEILLRMAEAIERVKTRAFAAADMEVNMARGHALRTGEAAKSIATMDTQVKRLDLLYDATRQAEEAQGTMAKTEGTLLAATAGLTAAQTNLQLTLSEASQGNLIKYRTNLAAVLNTLVALAQAHRDVAQTFIATGDLVLKEAIFFGGLLERVTSYAYFMSQIVKVEREAAAARAVATVATVASTVAEGAAAAAAEVEVGANTGLIASLNAVALARAAAFSGFLIAAAQWIAPLAAAIIGLTALVGLLSHGFGNVAETAEEAENRQRAYTDALADGRVSSEQVTQAYLEQAGAQRKLESSTEDLVEWVRKLRDQQQRSTQPGNTTNPNTGNLGLAAQLKLAQDALAYAQANPGMSPLSSHVPPVGEPKSQDFIDKYTDFGDRVQSAMDEIDSRAEKGIAATSTRFNVGVDRTVTSLRRVVRELGQAIDDDLEANKITAAEADAQRAKVAAASARVDEFARAAGARKGAYRGELLAKFTQDMDEATKGAEGRIDKVIERIGLWEEKGAEAGTGKLARAYLDARARLAAFTAEIEAATDEAVKPYETQLKSARAEEAADRGRDVQAYQLAHAKVLDLVAKIAAARARVAAEMGGAATASAASVAATVGQLAQQVDDNLAQFAARVAEASGKASGNLQAAALAKEDKAYGALRAQGELAAAQIDALVKAMDAAGDSAGAEGWRARLAAVRAELELLRVAHAKTSAEIKEHPLRFELQRLKQEAPGVAAALKEVYDTVLAKLAGGFDTLARRREAERLADLQFAQQQSRDKTAQSKADADFDHRQNLDRIAQSVATEEDKTKQVADENIRFYRQMRDMGQAQADQERQYAKDVADAHRNSANSIADVWAKTMDKVKQSAYNTLIEGLANNVLHLFHTKAQEAMNLKLNISAGGGSGGGGGGFLGFLTNALSLIPGVGPFLSTFVRGITSTSGGLEAGGGDSGGDNSGGLGGPPPEANTRSVRGIVPKAAPRGAHVAYGAGAARGGGGAVANNVQAAVTFAPTFNGVPEALMKRVDERMRTKWGPQMQREIEDLLDTTLRDPGVGVID